MPRKFPDSSVAWTAAFPAITTPGHIWTYQEASSPILDKIGSDNFAQNQALLYAQSGDPEPIGSPRLSLEFDTTAAAEFAAVASTTLGNIPSGTSWSLWFRTRNPDNASTARLTVNKGTGNPRWQVGPHAPTPAGAIRWFVNDGVNSFNITTTNAYDDSNYHDVLLVYDATANLFRLLVDAEVATAVSSATFTGVSSATPLRIGSGAANVLAGTRLSYMALWEGTAITAAQFTVLKTPQVDGSFSVSGLGAQSFSGLSDSPSQFSASGLAVFAASGLSDSPGEFLLFGSSDLLVDGLVDIAGGLSLSALGDFSATGDSNTPGNFDVAALSSVSFSGLSGVFGSVGFAGLSTFEDSKGIGFFFVSAQGSLSFSEDPICVGDTSGINGAISSFATGIYTVQRALRGVLVDGTYVPTVRGIFRLEACVQPASGRELQAVREGRWGLEVKVIYTTCRLLVQNMTHESDIFIYEGEPYEVMKVEKWEHWGSVHYRTWASKMVIP